jgi:hypothetical protein
MAWLRYTYAGLGWGSTAQANFSREDEHYVMTWCEDNDGDVTTISHLGNSTGMCNPYLYPCTSTRVPRLPAHPTSPSPHLTLTTFASPVEILIYGLILFTLFHQSVIVALHYDSIMSYYSS